MPESTPAAAPVRRPPPWEESLASLLFRRLAPRLELVHDAEPPPELAPWRSVAIPRPRGRAPLAGTWFPAAGAARGAVLLAPPWQRWGRAYFHRGGRLEALRAAGYHSLTVDLPNFVHGATPHGFYDRDLAAAAEHLETLCPDLPRLFWGVSSGGYWGHALLSRYRGFEAAMFEDVSPHLLEWSWRVAPWGRPCYRFFRRAFPRAYRFLDARVHAAHLKVARAAYVAGGRDAGIPTAASRELAGSGGYRVWIVEQAAHLESIQRAREAVLQLALETLAPAVACPTASSAPLRRTLASAGGNALR